MVAADDHGGANERRPDGRPAPLVETRAQESKHATEKRKDPDEVYLAGVKSRQRPTFPLNSIIGGNGLTAVFGMGTGVSRCLWSPTKPIEAPRPRQAMNRSYIASISSEAT
jgi:hypothetical protein